MSDFDDITVIEYNPCIRKGKYKLKIKKVKKYEAKVQKINLVRSKRGKLIGNSNHDAIISTSKELIDNMIKILMEETIYKWDDDYESLYSHICREKKNEELENKYINIKLKIDAYRYGDDYDNYDDYDDNYYYDDNYKCRFI